MAMEDHLADIDFRSRKVRQANHKTEFKNWYIHLTSLPYSETRQAQISMLSAVLWHLLPEKEYKKLTRRKPTLPISTPLS